MLDAMGLASAEGMEVMLWWRKFKRRTRLSVSSHWFMMSTVERSCPTDMATTRCILWRSLRDSLSAHGDDPPVANRWQEWQTLLHRYSDFLWALVKRTVAPSQSALLAVWAYFQACFPVRPHGRGHLQSKSLVIPWTRSCTVVSWAWWMLTELVCGQ